MDQNDNTVFDAEAFANTAYEGANDDKYTPVPAKEYVAVAKKHAFRRAKQSTICDLYWALDDQEARDATGMDEPQARQSLFLDLTPSGGLDMGQGKNVQLGKLRTALNVNDPSKPFRFDDLLGKPARIKVEHRIYEGDTFADVKAVTAL